MEVFFDAVGVISFSFELTWRGGLVRQLKRMIQETHGLPIAHQIFMFDDDVLGDDDNIFTHGIRHGSRIQVKRFPGVISDKTLRRLRRETMEEFSPRLRRETTGELSPSSQRQTEGLSQRRRPPEMIKVNLKHLSSTMELPLKVDINNDTVPTLKERIRDAGMWMNVDGMFLWLETFDALDDLGNDPEKRLMECGVSLNCTIWLETPGILKVDEPSASPKAMEYMRLRMDRDIGLPWEVEPLSDIELWSEDEVSSMFSVKIITYLEGSFCVEVDAYDTVLKLKEKIRERLKDREGDGKEMVLLLEKCKIMHDHHLLKEYQFVDTILEIHMYEKSLPEGGNGGDSHEFVLLRLIKVDLEYLFRTEPLVDEKYEQYVEVKFDDRVSILRQHVEFIPLESNYKFSYNGSVMDESLPFGWYGVLLDDTIYLTAS